MLRRTRTSNRRLIGVFVALFVVGLGAAQFAAASVPPFSPLASPHASQAQPGALREERSRRSTQPTSTPAPQGPIIVPPGGPPLVGSIALTDQSFICRGPVDLNSVNVTIDANSKTRLAVQLGQ